MTTKPTAVVVRLHDGKLSDQQTAALNDQSMTSLGSLLAIGTPVAGGELEVVGYITDNRPFGTNTLTHWILYKHRQYDREYGVVRQSDAQAALAAAQAEIAWLRDALEDAKTFHEEQDKAISKQPPSAQGQWRRHQHQEQIESIEAALKGPEA